METSDEAISAGMPRGRPRNPKSVPPPTMQRRALEAPVIACDDYERGLKHYRPEVFDRSVAALIARKRRPLDASSRIVQA